jgi:CheY-like chemotaxis protein
MAPMRILVVDDNPDQLAMLRVLIAGLGHEVRTEGSVAQAMDAARRFKPEIAFVDLGLPGMSGHDLGRMLKAELPGVRLYAVTGLGGEQDRETSMEAGFHGHLLKPIDFAVVESLLRPRAV